MLITAFSAIGVSEESYVSPYQGVPSDWPDDTAAADADTSTHSSFSYLTADGLRVGMDDGHFADYGLGYGFRWPDHSNYEALAVGWWGEGFTVGYAGGSVLYNSYESWSPAWGLHWSPTTETTIPFAGGVEFYESGSVGSLWLEQSTIIYDDEHDAALKITISNPSDSTISGIRYKRMVDWDVDLRVSPTGFRNYWDYFTLSDGAEVQTATGTRLHAWGKYHQAALVVPGAGCSELPTLHDQDGWGDRGWRTTVNHPDDNCALYDDAALFQWDFSLAPGESYEIMLFYLIDDTTGCRDTANTVADYDELFGKVCIVNEPPVADAGPDQTVEQTKYQGADVTLSGCNSTDDGLLEPLTYTWTWEGGAATGHNVTVQLPLGTTVVTLTVYDGEFYDSDTVNITVEDTTSPVVNAGFVPVCEDDDDECDDDDEGLFRIEFDASDICDADPEVSATVCCARTCKSVTNGQLVEIEFEDDECEFEYEDGILEIEGPKGKIVLKVTATDDSGNVGYAEAYPPIVPEDEEEEEEED